MNPVLTPAQLQDLYDGDYWGAAEHGLREGRRDFPRQYRVGRAYGRRLARESATGRMLEIGCGLPFFLRGVADNCAWEIEGLDPADGVAEFSRAKLGLQVHQGRFDGEAFPAEAYDCARERRTGARPRSP